MENINIRDALKEQKETGDFIDEMKEQTEKLKKTLNEMKEQRKSFKIESINRLFKNFMNAVEHSLSEIPSEYIRSGINHDIKKGLEYVKNESIKELLGP